jgi:uncharacterized membrane protein YgcG
VNYPGRGGSRPRVSSHARRTRVVRALGIGVGLFGVLLAASLLIIHPPYPSRPSPRAASQPMAPSVSLALQAAPSVNASAALQNSARPVYKYSVVPGGVRSAEELQKAAAQDPSVAAHYAGFRYRQAHVARLKKPALMYLSYRMNGRILWTKAPHVLPAGETVLTDGNMTARTRCANQLSAQKRLPVAGAEPSLAQLEELIPPVKASLPAQYDSVLSSPSSPAGTGPLGSTPLLGGGPSLPPPLPSGGGSGGGGGNPGGGGGNPGGGGGGGTDEPPPAPVPEPGSWLLVSSGLAALAAAYRKRRGSS